MKMTSRISIPSLMTISAILTLLLTAVNAQNTSSSTPTHLNVTALTAANMTSILQCWQLTSPLTDTSVPGVTGSLDILLSNTTNISYTVIPPRFNGGLHNAPMPQWVVFLSGLAHITLPNTTVGPETEAWLVGGKYGVLFAGDTRDVSTYGHITDYPSDADTVVLQVPVAGTGEEAVPGHVVLYDGPCRYSELVGV